MGQRNSGFVGRFRACLWSCCRLCAPHSPWGVSTAACPRSVVEHGYQAGKKPARCRNCGKTFPRPNVTLSPISCQSKRRRERKVAVKRPLFQCLVALAGFPGVTRHANRRNQMARMQSWRTRRSKQTMNCGRFSRLCQMNTERTFTETVSSRRCNRWTSRRQLSWPPKFNSFPHNVGLKSRKYAWRDARKTSGRSSRHDSSQSGDGSLGGRARS